MQHATYFHPEEDLPVAVLAEPIEVEAILVEGYDAEIDVVDQVISLEGQHATMQQQHQHDAEQIAHAEVLSTTRGMHRDRNRSHNHHRDLSLEATIPDNVVRVALEPDDLDGRVPAALRIEQPLPQTYAAPYLFDMVRQGYTCKSVLGGWSRQRLEEGCHQVVQRCETMPDDAFYVAQNGRTPLHEACLRGSCCHVVKALLTANEGAAFQRDQQENTPLHLLFVDHATQIAALHPQQEIDNIVTEILAINPTILASTANAMGNTALHMACSAPESMLAPNTLKQLIFASPDSASAVNNLNQTPLLLHCARRNASAHVAKILFDAYPPAAVAVDGNNGWTPLHYAAASANIDLIRFLVEADATSASVLTEKGETALHLLCRLNHLGLPHIQAIALLSQADPQSVTRQDSRQMQTPLHLVCRGGQQVSVQIVERLIETNPEAAQISDSEQYLPLHYACETGCHPTVLSALLRCYPAGARAMTRKQDSPLSLACSCNKDVETVQMLIAANPMALSIRNDYGYAPLHCACRAYHPRMGIVEALLDACPSCVALRSHGGETPLHLASSNPGVFVGVLQLLTEAQNKLNRLHGVPQSEPNMEPCVKPMTSKVGNTPRKFLLLRICFITVRTVN